MLRGLVVSILALLTIPLAGCGDSDLLARWMLKPERIIIERSPDPFYEQLFPYYVELCATSQLRSTSDIQGGVTGHATLYLKGACKDEQAAFPLLRRCHRAATRLDDPEHGAGVSVGRWFRNVNWVAVPGYELMYSGNLAPGERLTRERLDATIQEAIDRGVYAGVEFQQYPSAGEDSSLANFIARHGIGTDFALQFARTGFCSRLPLTETMLDEVMAFLNDKNREYALGEADYNWDLLADNCVHTVRNALAAANVWTPLSVMAVKLQRLFNLAVPANEFVNLARLTTQGNIADERAIQGEGPSRDALHEFRWLPTRHGALLKTLPVHEPNDIYDTTFRLFTLQSPFRMGKTQAAIDLLSDDRYVDLEKNLRLFRDRYDAILAGRDERADMLASVRGTPYRRVGRLHDAYIEAQRADADALLQRLAELKRSAAAAEAEAAEPR